MSARVVRPLARWSGVLAAVAAILAVSIHVTWAPATPAAIGPVPAVAATMDVTTATTGLTDGATVSFVVTTTGAVTLSKIDAKLCAHGFTTYGATTFGYDGSSGIRCVYEPTITSGGLTGAQYRVGPTTYSAVKTSGTVPIKVGTGTVEWINNTGDGPTSITCDGANQCDLVVEVGVVGDLKPTTYFIQPLSFAGSGVTTTTTAATTTTGPTTTTAAPTTTTTAPTTTTTAPTTTTTTAATTTTLAPGNSATPSTLAPGGVVTVASTGWKPASTVTVVLHSDPVTLGTLTADAQGAVSGPFTIPTGTAAGSHTVELTGSDPQSAAKTQTFPITVATSTTGGTTTGGTTTGSPTSTAGALAFTGSSARDLASLGLLLLAFGLFLVARTSSRQVAEDRS